MSSVSYLCKGLLPIRTVSSTLFPPPFVINLKTLRLTTSHCDRYSIPFIYHLAHPLSNPRNPRPPPVEKRRTETRCRLFVQILVMDSHFIHCLRSMCPFFSRNQMSGSKIMDVQTDVGSTR